MMNEATRDTAQRHGPGRHGQQAMAGWVKATTIRQYSKAGVVSTSAVDDGVVTTPAAVDKDHAKFALGLARVTFDAVFSVNRVAPTQSRHRRESSSDTRS